MLEHKLIHWSALFVAVAANVVANTALKMAVGSLETSARQQTVLELLGQVSLWIGLVSAGVLLVSYLAALRGFPASIAYMVVTTLAMIGLVIVDNRLFDVPLNAGKLIGIGFALAGVWLMTRGS